MNNTKQMTAATMYLSGTAHLGEDIRDNVQRAFHEHKTKQAQRLRDNTVTYHNIIAAYDAVLALNLLPPHGISANLKPC